MHQSTMDGGPVMQFVNRPCIRTFSEGESLINPRRRAADHLLNWSSEFSQPYSSFVGTVAVRPGAVDDEQRVFVPRR